MALPIVRLHFDLVSDGNEFHGWATLALFGSARQPVESVILTSPPSTPTYAARSGPMLTGA